MNGSGEAPIKYKRLPGRGTRGMGSSSLWLGPDHILKLDQVWVNEDFKRFYFRDIQAITIEQTNAAFMWNWIIGTIFVISAFIFGMLAADAGDAQGRMGYIIAGSIVCGLFLGLWMWSLARGPSCTCRVRTAVQTEALQSLHWVKKAHQVMAILRPLIEQAQGALSAEALARQAAEPQGVSRPPPLTRAGGAARPPAGAERGTEVRRESGMLHTILFAVLVADSLLGFCDIYLAPRHLPVPLAVISTLGVLGLSIAALVRQRGTDLPGSVRRLTLLSFIYPITDTMISFLYVTIAAGIYVARHPGRVAPAALSPSMYGYRTYSLISNIIELALGAAGLFVMLLYLERRSRAEAASESTEGAK